MAGIRTFIRMDNGSTYRLTKGRSVQHVKCISSHKGSSYLVTNAAHKQSIPHRVHASQFDTIKLVRACTHKPIIRKRAAQAMTTQLYIFQIGRCTYKIGCSDNVDSRLRAGKTWSAMAKTKATRSIPAAKTGLWRKYEKRVHTKFQNNRCPSGGREVFRFSSSEATRAVDYLKRMKFT